MWRPTSTCVCAGAARAGARARARRKVVSAARARSRAPSRPFPPPAHPHPQALPREENPLFASVAQFCEAVGINDPLTNVYLTTSAELQPPMGLWLALVALATVGGLVWDPELGNLVRRAPPPKEGKEHEAAALDGAPFIVGIVTLLKQLHPAVTDDFVSHVGQYLRSMVGATTGALVTKAAVDGPKSDALREAARAPPGLPRDAATLLLLLQQVCRVAHVPDRVLHAAVPAPLLNA